ENAGTEPLSSSHAIDGSEHVPGSSDSTVSVNALFSVLSRRLDIAGRLSVNSTSTPPPGPKEHPVFGVWSLWAPTSVLMVTPVTMSTIASCSPVHASEVLPADAQLGSPG